MDVPAWVWLATVGGLVVLLALDLVIVDRKPHEVGIAEASRWVVFHIACAVAFGLGVWLFTNGDFAVQYFAGYVTEYSLSVDNLFIFVIIMAAFGVPAVPRKSSLWSVTDSHLTSSANRDGDSIPLVRRIDR